MTQMNHELPRGLTAAERETVIQMDDEGDRVSICTSQAPVARKLFKAGATLVRESTRNGVVTSQTFSVPTSYFRWSVRAPRKLSDAARATRLASLAKAREGRP